MDHEENEVVAKPQHHLGSTRASALVISASYKAGMDGIDRDRIDAIILRESAGSRYLDHQEKLDNKTNERIRQMEERLGQKNQTEPNWKRHLQHQLDPEVDEILKGRRNRATCCVIDMDMFFMACELLSRPHLKDKPCCVGRNMISTSNYKARQYGVRSAMAGWIGDKLVEELSGGTETLVHLPSNFKLYKEKSKAASQVLQQFDPKCRMCSLDEAFVDLEPYLALKLSNQWDHKQVTEHLQKSLVGTPKSTENSKAHYKFDSDAILQRFPPGEILASASDTVQLLRSMICQVTGGLTCSAGVAPSFMIAKIASDYNKPNGQKIVGERLEEDVWPFLRPLPTRKIPGIGRVTAKMLSSFGIDSVQQLWEDRALVRFLFKPATAKFLLRSCLGGFGKADGEEHTEDGEDEITSGIKRKGVSRERTFSALRTWPELMNMLEDIAWNLSNDMERESVYARTISLKIKLQTFDVFQKSRTVDSSLQKGGDLLKHAAEMLQELKKEVGNDRFTLRLIGIRCSNLEGATDEYSPLRRQMSNFLSGQSKAHAPRSLTLTSDQMATKDESDALKPTSNYEAHTSQSNMTTTTTSKSDVATRENTASCPICNKSIRASSTFSLNRRLNEHVDSCLNATLIRKVVRETNALPKRKKLRLTDYFVAS